MKSLIFLQTRPDTDAEFPYIVQKTPFLPNALLSKVKLAGDFVGKVEEGFP